MNKRNSWAFNQHLLSIDEKEQIVLLSGGPLRFREEEIEDWFQAVQEFKNILYGGNNT